MTAALRECPLEHRSAGLHLMHPSRCAHYGDEWIALERHEDGSISFTAYTDHVRGGCTTDIWPEAELVWERAENALIEGHLRQYVEAICGRFTIRGVYP